MKQVKQSHVQLTHVPGAVIAKKSVKANGRIRQVYISPSINNIDPLVCMGVQQP